MQRIVLGFFTLIALPTLSACGEDVSVHVDCITTAAPAIECQVAQTKGKADVEVCWDFAVTCKNGTKIAAPRSCTHVKDGATVKHTIPGDKLTNLDKCDSEPKAALSNMTIDGKTSSN